MPYLEVGLPNIDKIFEKLGINPKTRAEDIKVEKWLQISRDLPTNF
jgi:16S rRNA A1518/A1519 N6-dimethyltransferase RsmA/KsgA/DIM1 with predicted DNA glycosylase/AP lyase activity